MTQPKRVAIDITGPGRGTIHVDDHKLQGVTGFTATHSVKDFMRVTVNLVMHEGTINGEAIVSVPERAAASLVALGWTPPPVSLIKA